MPSNPGPAARPIWSDLARNVNFNSANAYPGLAGPGTIETPTSFIFNKVGPIFFNTGLSTTNLVAPTYFIETQQLVPIWGSFDGTTNEPIVYPNGTDITTLESQVLIQITNPSLPNGRPGVSYAAQFNVNGGTAPYTWEILDSQDHTGLPPGLSLDPNTGVISGTPNSPGAYDFIVRLTDAGARFTDWIFTITINP